MMLKFYINVEKNINVLEKKFHEKYYFENLSLTRLNSC